MVDPAREQAMAESLAGIRTDIATLSTEVRLLIARIDPKLADYEQRIRALEQSRLEHEDLPARVRDVERWQWRRDAPLALGSSTVGGAIVAVINTLAGG